MTTFTLRQEHLDLLAKAEIVNDGRAWAELWDMRMLETLITSTRPEELNDAKAIMSECVDALAILLQSRGAAVPLGRYERKEGRWSLVEEME